MKRGPGRPKGSANKLTADMRTMVDTALNELGGAKYLVKAAKDPRTAAAFLGLVGKCLPKDVIIDKTVRHESTLSDAELERIAASGNDGTATTKSRTRKISGIH